jgi:uncharacterized protein YndB with AHSA1/START domain
MTTRTSGRRTITGHAAQIVAESRDAVFRSVTDVARLPSWNTRMTRVVTQPEALRPGAEWVVEFHVLGRTWQSRSTVDELDEAAGRFTYRSRTDDGNPSQATWSWTVNDDPAGSRVDVTWSLQPVTFWRRVLLGRIRARQLARTEVPASLASLASSIAITPAG